jgi:CheY-like chemotaxis protein
MQICPKPFLRNPMLNTGLPLLYPKADKLKYLQADPGLAGREESRSFTSYERIERRMVEEPKNFSILVAEDDPDDRLLIKRALEGAGFTGNLQFVNDGVELMTYLHRSKCPENSEAFPRPDLILLDLHMPRKNGREALQDMNADPDSQKIIVVAMTGTELPNDAEICGRLGAKRLIPKPDSYMGWVGTMSKVIGLLAESK